jgi:hypothetical protein
MNANDRPVEPRGPDRRFPAAGSSLGRPPWLLWLPLV